MDETERMYDLMRKESNRLKTFQMNPRWPKDYVDIKKLAKAGFFYAFNEDNVHCAFCRGQVCRWDRDDDPMTEHARHFTTCPFIMGGEVGNEPLGDDPIPGPKRPRPYDVCGIYQDPPSSYMQPPQQEQQPHQRFVDSSAYQHLVQHNNIDLNGANHFNNTNSQLPLRYRPQLHQELLHQQHNQSQQLYQQQHQQLQRLIIPNQPPNIISHHPPAYDESSSESNNHNSLNSSMSGCSNNSSNNLNGICKICYTNSIELVFLPCGHSVSCLSCATRLQSCPCCRATITTRIRTFLV